MTRGILKTTAAGWLCALALFIGATQSQTALAHESSADNQVLEWNQIFTDTLVATNTPNSSSQRLGAIVHTAIFDAFNGIERRYTPIRVPPAAPPDASRRAAAIAAAYTALLGLFPARQLELDASFSTSLAALDAAVESELASDRNVGLQSRTRALAWRARQRGIAWGTEVAREVLLWRANDGFSGSYPAFAGGSAVGQWRPVPPATSMSAQPLAFTEMFVLADNTQFRPPAPRALDSITYTRDLNAVSALGRKTGSTRTDDQTALAPFWEGNASVHWNQAANQIARANRLSMSESSRLFAVLNIAMADTALTIWSAKRAFGEDVTAVTWRPITAITMADSDGISDTVADAEWLPLVPTPSHPEYPAGHPGQNGAAATVLLAHFLDHQTFTLSTPNLPSRTYHRITQARADGNNARVWGGMHYPSTVEISSSVGAAIARHVNRNSMQRVHRKYP